MTCSNGGAHFSSTLLNIRRTMLLIEPLSQSDRASLNSCFSDSQTPQSRVSFFFASTCCRAKGTCHEHQAGLSRGAGHRNLSELQKRDDSSASHADLSRERF